MYFGECWIWLIQWIYYCFKLLLKCLYQARKVGGHIYVLKALILTLSTVFLLDFLKCSYSVVYFCFSIRFLKCSYSVVYFCFSIRFLKCSYSVVYFCFHAITEIDSLLNVYFCSGKPYLIQ